MDGGLATLLENKYNCDLNHKLWSSIILENQPELVYNAHKDFAISGADIMICCTYQSSLEGFDNDRRVFEKSIENAVKVAKDAVRDSEKETGRKAFVAGSCGSYGASIPGGTEYTGDYLQKLSDQEKVDFLVKWHRNRFDIIDNLGCDYLTWETMPTRIEGVACSQIIAKGNTPSWITFVLKDEATLCNGDSLLSTLESLEVSKNLIGVGTNCSDLNYTTGAIKIIKAYYDDPKNFNENNPKHIVVYPNSGEIYSGHHEWFNKEGMENTLKDFSDLAVLWHSVGATIIGGCCRVSPQEINEVYNKFNVS